MSDGVDILGIDAHMADEIAYGLALASCVRQGGKVAMLHITPGEKGHPTLSAADYAAQKREEARAAAAVLGAPLYTLDYGDGELPVNDTLKFQICDVIRACKPKVIITHWQGSIHKDHTNCALNVPDAIFYAALRGFERTDPAHRGVRLYFSENWEDMDGFAPEVYLEVTPEDMAMWEEMCKQYALFRGGVSTFRYMDYYRAMAQVRGCEVGTQYAVAFGVSPLYRRRKVTNL
jgi:N-acetylglucosamine malate deacetylase 1